MFECAVQANITLECIKCSALYTMWMRTCVHVMCLWSAPRRRCGLEPPFLFEGTGDAGWRQALPSPSPGTGPLSDLPPPAEVLQKAIDPPSKLTATRREPRRGNRGLEKPGGPGSVLVGTCGWVHKQLRLHRKQCVERRKTATTPWKTDDESVGFNDQVRRRSHKMHPRQI